MAIETITPEAYVQRNLSDPLLNNGHQPNERIIGNETNGAGSVEEHTDEQAFSFRSRITTSLLENRQRLETIYPGVGFDLEGLRRKVAWENDQKKGFRGELRAELAGWIAANDQRVLVTDSGRKRKTPSSIYQAAKRVAGQILVHSRKDLSGIEEFAAHFQADLEKSQQLQTLKGRIEEFNTYRKQLGRCHRQASYYLRDATELIIWQDYLDNHQRIHDNYDVAKGLPDALQASELVAKIETVIPAEVRSGKQPRNKLRRELWQYAQSLEQVRTQQKTALIPNQLQITLNEHTNITAEPSPGTIQEVVKSSDNRLVKVAAFIGLPATAAGLVLLYQFLRILTKPLNKNQQIRIRD